MKVRNPSQLEILEIWASSAFAFGPLGRRCILAACASSCVLIQLIRPHGLSDQRALYDGRSRGGTGMDVLRPHRVPGPVPRTVIPSCWA